MQTARPGLGSGGLRLDILLHIPPQVGLQILPVDGNPHKTCAIVCHPDGVAGLTLSYDGSYAFTAGGRDRSVVQWEVNLRCVAGHAVWPLRRRRRGWTLLFTQQQLTAAEPCHVQTLCWDVPEPDSKDAPS